MPTITVRIPNTAEERLAWYEHAVATFADPDATDKAERAIHWRRFIEEAPNYARDQMRTAYIDKTLVGGCYVYERRMRLGPSLLSTACIGAVFTRPEYRKQGVATAIMADALAFARSRHHALLLLDGIPNFYHRYGYYDVLDFTRHSISRAAALALDPAPYTVRAATSDDAQVLLDLYQRHFGTHTGGFARDLPMQSHMLRMRSPNNPGYIACNPAGVARGYLFLSRPPYSIHAQEIAADDWPAARALLHHHATLASALTPPPTEISWGLPLRAPLITLLADHFSVDNLTDMLAPAQPNECVIRSETYITPRGGWLARVADWDTLWQALTPAWQPLATNWTHPLALYVDDASCVLVRTPQGLTRMRVATPDTLTVRLTSRAFIPWLFGYRTLDWVRAQPEQSIPHEAVPFLEKLMPSETFWVPGTDMF